MIEFLQKSEKEYSLVINGEIIENTKVSISTDFNSKEPFYEIHSENVGLYKKIGNYSLSSFPPLYLIYFLTDFHWVSDQIFVSCWVMSEESSIENKDKFFEISLDFEASLENWTKSSAFSQYFNELKKLVDQSKSMKILMNDESGGLEYGFLIKQVEKVKGSQLISSVLIDLFEKVKDLNSEVKRKLALLNLDALTLFSFDFPKELKIPCEQYLLYFAQFLQDLGINATSNLKEEAGKVLFSVTPTDDVEALDKIREALAIYLSLSSNPISHSTGDRTIDMVLSGARANAKHLESQLELAVAKLQFKEATLELKDATIEQNQLALRQRDDTIKDLKEMLARGNIFEESLEKVVINGEVVEETSLYRFSREDDIEVEATPVLDKNNEETKIGLVKFHEVTKLKEYGVSLDLPKAIKDLMDYFKRDKDK